MLTQKWIGRTVTVMLLLCGLYFLVFRVLGADLDGMPGDLGDTRFNNYVLEHGYRYLAGEEPYFWGAPFFYPEGNAITYSDNLLGVMPLYASFRMLGLDRESALQGWFAISCLLNFLSAWWVLRKMSGNTIAAAAGAYVFAFGLPVLAQINHLQLIPRFFAPFAIWYLLRFMQSFHWKDLAWMSVAMVAQFYGSMYLGFLLVLIMAVMAGVYVIVDRSWDRLNAQLLKKESWKWTLVLFSAALVIFPLAWKYYLRSREIGMRPWDDVEPLLPRISSFLYPGKGSWLWSVFESRANDLVFPWEHVIFPGGIAFLALLLLPFFKKLSGKKLQKEYLVLAITLVIVCLLFLYVGGYTFYKYIFKLPGFGSMRAPVRFMLLLLFFFSVFIALWIAEISSSGGKKGWMIAAVCAMVVIVDQGVSSSALVKVSKSEVQHRIAPLVDKIKESDRNNFNAIAYLGSADEDANMVQLDGMLAAQACGMKTVNGYSSSSPFGYYPFWVQHTDSTLLDWLKYKGFEAEFPRILVIRKSDL